MKFSLKLKERLLNRYPTDDLNFHDKMILEVGHFTNFVKLRGSGNYLCMRLITRQELAQRAGVTPPAVTKLCAPDKRLHGATNKKNKKIDSEHPSVIEWLEERASVRNLNTVNIKEFDNLTFKEVLNSHHTMRKAGEVLKMRKSMVDIELKTIKIKQLNGELVSRDIVAKTCFGILEVAFTQFLKMPESTIPKLFAICKSGRKTAEFDAQQEMEKKINKILHNSKDSLSQVIGEWREEE